MKAIERALQLISENPQVFSPENYWTERETKLIQAGNYTVGIISDLFTDLIFTNCVDSNLPANNVEWMTFNDHLPIYMALFLILVPDANIKFLA